ncbi:MAG: phosphatidylserine decarboxylase [Candidatus Binataceae bacterium]
MDASEVSGPRPAQVFLIFVAKALHLAPEGIGITLAIAGASVVAWVMGLSWLALIGVILALAVAGFFRDPERTPDRVNDVVLSGADGRVTDIVEAALPGAASSRFRRVSVFMSPLNVHVNRASVSAEVLSVTHTAGEFRAAFRDYASEHNERNTIVFKDPDGRDHAMVQIAGYLARRIVCRLRPGDRIMIGQRIGMIMFGSRVDHYLPLEYRLAVKLGDRVRAGESVIGERA